MRTAAAAYKWKTKYVLVMGMKVPLLKAASPLEMAHMACSRIP